MTDCEASKQFCNQLAEGIEKKITLFEVFSIPTVAFFFPIISFQGGYHELHNEPDGVREKLADTIIAFIEGHLLGKNAIEEVEATSSGPGPAKTTVEAKI